MDAEPSRHNRKLFRVTDSTFQKQFMLFCFTVGSITTSVALIGVMLTVYRITDAANSTESISWEQVQELLRYQLRFAWLMVAVVTIVNLVVCGLMSHFFSHRASGIILRVTKTLNGLAEGQAVSTIKARKDDFFADLVEAVNRLIEKKG